MVGSGIITRTAHAIGAGWNAAATSLGLRPKNHQVVQYDPYLDERRDAMVNGLNVRKLKAYIEATDAGNLALGLQFCEEMERRDLHLRSVSETRRRAVTGLPWEIVSAADIDERVDRNAADDAANYCADHLRQMDGFEEALQYLGDAFGPNLKVLEHVWNGVKLVKLVSVPDTRLSMDRDCAGVVRVATRDNRDGVPATLGDWTVFTPHGGRTAPFYKSLTIGQAYHFLAKMMGFVDWGAYLALYGMPTRWATHPPGATPKERSELVAMMRGMGSNGYAVFPQGTTLEFKESSQRGVAPFQAMIEYCDRKQSVLFTGGNITSDSTGAQGTLAAGVVQSEVRQDLRDADIKAESMAISSQILGPMVRYMFGPGVPVPVFQRIKPETIDREREARVIAAAQNAGLKVPMRWAYERVGIPEPEENEAVLTPGLDAFGAALTEGVPVEPTAQDGIKGSEVLDALA